MFADPLDCHLIRKFNRAAQALSVSGRALPLEVIRSEFAQLEQSYHAAARDRADLCLYMSQMVREHVFLAAIARQMSVPKVIYAFRSASALGFRSIHAKTSLTMILGRYLLDHGRKRDARALLKTLKGELKATAALCEENLHAISDIFNR